MIVRISNLIISAVDHIQTQREYMYRWRVYVYVWIAPSITSDITSDISLSSSWSPSSFDQDFLGFFIEKPSPSPSPENIIFCGNGMCLWLEVAVVVNGGGSGGRG
ncbi:hypothetical protein HanRHA438_Chr16g0739731 [Helianthus annuus]|nr:hypothetical protein HanHA300_Chr16g0592921 [Helianthus annuus]KAJ0458926.1 hypothetical protein HanHA89_Chr16g0643231 [Helianthus annuus]KAJ0639466.1 hypothetical protein HanLR1_Chr16g0604211 [Helianthus annuus]KAJ0834083.1 hypothetical protein HanRHA438_Chr16g0739731 [Helianthus annuus]